jgi:hypothetical protein
MMNMLEIDSIEQHIIYAPEINRPINLGEMRIE